MTQMTVTLGRRVLVLAFVAVGAISARAEQSPRELYERARLAEENTRTLSRALELYKQAAAEAGTDRTFAAEVELRAALVLERQGNPEARAALARVARNYADLPAGRTASTRLAEAAAQSTIVAPRVIRNLIDVPQSFSFDGTRVLVIPFRGTSEVAVVDLATGTRTTLIEPIGQARATGPLFSPDGRSVAYGWAGQTRVMAAQPGATPATVIEATAGVQRRVIAWSPNGQALLVAAVRGVGEISIEWVSLRDRSRQSVTAFESWRMVGAEDGAGFANLRVSPADGQVLAYSAAVSRGSSDRYIYLLNTVSGQQSTAVAVAGANIRPVWAPDGSKILFVNERSGLRSLWAVDVRGGQAAGEPRQVLASYTGVPAEMTLDGSLLSVHPNAGEFVESVAERTASGAHVVQIFNGRAGTWSRDNRLAFVRAGSDRTWDSLIVREMGSGAERTYRRPGGFYIRSPRWLPDGSGLIVFLGPNQDPAGPAFHRVDLSTGATVRLFPKDTASHQRSEDSLVSPDGRELFLLSGPGQFVWTGMVAVDLATGAERRLMTFPGAGITSRESMAMGPDGRTIFITAAADGDRGRQRVVAVDIDGSNWREIWSYSGQSVRHALGWTPDGLLVLQRPMQAPGTAAAPWRVLRVPSAGGEAVFDGLDSSKLSSSVPLPRFDDEAEVTLDVSPDGRRVAFSARTLVTRDVTLLDNLLARLAR